MKKEIHKSHERGESDLGWLHSRFSFSFADYYNPKRMGFGKLRVLNDDIVKPGKWFGMHQHSNMEIISIILEGELEHQDSTGTKEILKEGDIQVMSAGSGVVHSEKNNSVKNTVKFFQIWIEPKEKNIEPRHDKKSFKLEQDKLNLVVSGNKKDSALFINQDAKIFLGRFTNGIGIAYEINDGKGVFAIIIGGTAEIEGANLEGRDSMSISQASKIRITPKSDVFLMLIDVPV